MGPNRLLTNQSRHKSELEFCEAMGFAESGDRRLHGPIGGWRGQLLGDFPFFKMPTFSFDFGIA